MAVEKKGACIRRCIGVKGIVQGVGFRPFVYRLATKHGLGGWVLNSGRGVQIELEGSGYAIDAFVSELQTGCPPLGRIGKLSIRACEPKGERSFRILDSSAGREATAGIPPDVSICKDCIEELLDASDRRYRYPFINCTQCGPRFTIVESVPYDRPKTTMDAFDMCASCKGEYTNPRDRRFHAEPIACPACGPQLAWQTPAGEESFRGERALQHAVQRIACGAIVAIKGLGGFHIACDATNREAVSRLRRLKRRPGRPFAVMSRSLQDVARYAEFSEDERKLLLSLESPIVLIRKRPGTTLEDEVAPGLDTLGVMLAYTPLHILLFESGERFLALVMTSGNRCDEPIARTNEGALDRLAGIVDGFLMHDRPIHNRADDSIVQVVAGGGGRVLRRARGYVPTSLPVEIETRIFAAGAELKSTFCLARSGEAVVSQHIGDLDDEISLSFYTETFEKYCRLLDFEAEKVCCDLHPDYLSTRFAADYAGAERIPITRVQHHEAHVASVLAEHGFPGTGDTASSAPVLGVAFDGTGYGTDGAIWGGEFFLFEGARAVRLAHLAYFPLPGGDAAVREVWRSALAVLSTCGIDDFPSGSLGDIPAGKRETVLRMMETRTNCPVTSSMGRFFDAASVIAGLGHFATYEAEAAMRLEAVAGNNYTPYPFEIVGQHPAQVRLEKLIHGLLADRSEPGILSSRFHATIADLILKIALRARDECDVRTVALTGGVFQNRLLSELALARLAERGFRVLTNRLVPPNDGGLSLGQAWLAFHRRGE